MPHLAGHLELACGVDERRRSFLREQRFKAPFYINKPYYDRDVLMVQVINPTPGLFAGDRIRSVVQVDADARLALSSPSACRLHAMPDGRAESVQEFFVGSGGWLECVAAPLIPQAQSRFRQKTTIHAAHGSELFFQEVLTPGRVARGEVFAFAEIDWEFDLYHDDILIVRERFKLGGGGGDVGLAQNHFATPYYASTIVMTDRPLEFDEGWARIEALNSSSLRIGSTRLLQSGWSIKMLASDSLALRQGISNCRAILAEAWPWLSADIRRL